MRHKFLAQPEQITRHYGIRPAIFEGVLPVYAVVMLEHPQHVILSLIKQPAAAHYCHDLERVNFGYDEEHSHV